MSFAGSQDDGEPGGSPDAFDAGDVFEFALEDLLVKKEQSTKSLVLSGGGDAPVEVKMAEECGDLFFAHFFRVTFVVKENETPDPIEVGLLGTDAVAFDPEVPANAVEEFGWVAWAFGRFSEPE